MKPKKQILQQLTGVADLTDELIPGETLIEITGQNRVLIEHHKGVSQYDSQSIGVRVNYGLICVTGHRLELSHMTKEKLVIGGNIECIRLLGGN